MFHTDYFDEIKVAVAERRASLLAEMMRSDVSHDRTQYLRGSIAGLDACLQYMRDLNGRLQDKEAA